MLEHATVGTSTVPWLNDYLQDRGAGRQESQRRLFGRLLEVAPAVAVNTAYAGPDEISDKLLGVLR